MRRFEIRVADLFYLEGIAASDGRCVLFWFGEAQAEQGFRSVELAEAWLSERFGGEFTLCWRDPEPEPQPGLMTRCCHGRSYPPSHRL